MHIQIINFNLKDLSHETYVTYCSAVAPDFAKVPGLLSKTWLANRDENIYGGVYLWESAEAMAAFRLSDLFNSVSSNPNLANITSRDYAVLDAPTKVTGAANAMSLVD